MILKNKQLKDVMLDSQYFKNHEAAQTKIN